MGIPLLVESQFDERTGTAAANRAERFFAQAGKDAAQGFSRSFAGGAQGVEDSLKRIGDKASDAYDRQRDAAGRLRAEEEKLSRIREQGARNDQIVAQAERVERARRAEVRALRDATDAYADYERAAENAGRDGGQSFMHGFSGAASGARDIGQEFSDGFSGGFMGAASLGGMGSAALRLGGFAAAGVMAGKLFMDNVGAGMDSLRMQDLYQAKLGVDTSTIEKLGRNASDAYVRGWGVSPAQNFEVQQFGIQSGLIGADANDAEIQKFIAQMHTAQATIGEDAQAIAQGVMNFTKTNLTGSTQEAFDVVVAAAQQGLNISGDLLESAREYGIVWDAVGLSAQDAFGMIKQMRGAKDTDQAADSLKELSINVVNSSDLTKQAFTAMGLDADQLTRKFAEGGPAARQAFGEVLAGLQAIKDPLDKENVGAALFKTKWEDAKKAIVGADLATAATELGQVTGATDTASAAISKHADQWDLLGRNIDKAYSSLQVWLAQSPVGQFLTDTLPKALDDFLFRQQSDPGLYNPSANVPGIAPPDQGQSLADSGLLSDPSGPSNPFLPSLGMPTTANPAGTPPPGVPDSSIPPTDRVTPVPMGTGPDGKPSFDPSQYSLDAIPIGQFVSDLTVPGAGPSGQTIGAPMWNQTEQGYGQYVVDQGRVFDAETSRLSAQQNVEQARIRVLELQADGTHTQQEINAARMAEVTAERQYQSAAMKLAEAQQGTWKKLESTASKFASGMDDIGASLDQDFGISDGLPGIAENITKMLANFAMAPVVGALTGVQMASGYNGGSGLMGIMGAQGMFGQQYVRQAMSAAGGYGPSALGPAALMPGGPVGTALPGEGARDFAHRVMMPFWESRGLTVGDHQADQYGEHQNGALDIMVPSIAAGNQVIQEALSDPNVYGAIFNNQTFGYGHGPSPRDYTAGHTGDPNQDHQNHAHIWYKPGGPNNITTGGGSGLGPTPPGPAIPGSPVIQPGAGLPAGMSPGLTFQPTPNWGGNPGLPSVTGGGGGRGYMGFDNGPGIGGAAGQQYPSNPAGGQASIGGFAKDALDGAAGALNLIAPGAGQAAQVGIELANRGIEFAGQAAGIGVSGLFEALLPSGDNPMASIGNSWLGKAFGGLAGARPALPNMAGQQAPPPNPNGNNNNGQPGNNYTQTNNVEVTNTKKVQEYDEAKLRQELGSSWPPGKQ